MTLRLVLVSLVAGLGIGIPNPADIEGWVASSRSWMNACLVEMGLDRTAGDVLALADDLRPLEMERSPVAQATESEASLSADPATLSPPQTTAIDVAASPEQSPLPAFEPIEVDERMYVGLAHDLNYFGEGLGMLPKLPVPAEPRPSAVRLDELAELAIARHGADASRFVGRLGRELNAIAAREIAERNFLAMETTPELYFARPEESGLADAVESKPPASEDALASAFDAMERSESLYFAESVSVEAPAPVFAELAELPALPEDPFAPADPVESIAETTVDDQPAGPPAEPAPVRRVSVTRAVRLTGEAMAAWVNVFAEPTLAAVSPSSNFQ